MLPSLFHSSSTSSSPSPLFFFLLPTLTAAANNNNKPNAIHYRSKSHSLLIKATKTTMEEEQKNPSKSTGIGIDPSLKLLFVEMGVGYDQHGQDITIAAMRACKDAISSNSIPAFRRGNIPGVGFGEMKLQIKLGVPCAVQQFLDIDRVKSVFPYGEILNVDVVDGGLICSSGVHVEEMGDKNDDCYIVNAAVYVGY